MSEKTIETIKEMYGYSIDEFSQLHEDIQVFIQAMALQHQRIAMPDICPTKFGISIYKKILICKK